MTGSALTSSVRAANHAQADAASPAESPASARGQGLSARALLPPLHHHSAPPSGLLAQAAEPSQPVHVNYGPSTFYKVRMGQAQPQESPPQGTGSLGAAQPSAWPGCSEIEPCVDEQVAPSQQQQQRKQRPHTAGLLQSSSPPMSIPTPPSGDTHTQPRTYRVVISPHNDSSPLSSVSVKQVLVDRVDSGPPPLSSSQRGKSGGLLGSLARSLSRNRVTQQDTDLLPHNYRCSPTPDTLAASSPLEVGSVLGRASGLLLKRQASSKLTQQASESEVSTRTPKESIHQSTIKRAFASVDNLQAMLSGTWPRPLDLRGGPIDQPNPTTSGPNTNQPYRESGGSNNSSVRGGHRYMNSNYQGQIGSDRLVSSSGERPLEASLGSGSYYQHVSDWHQQGSGGHGGHVAIHHTLSSRRSVGPTVSSLPLTVPGAQRTGSLLAMLQHEAGHGATMCAADIAVLSSSLPASFGQPSAAVIRRVDSITGSQPASRAASTVGDPNEVGWSGGLGYGVQGGQGVLTPQALAGARSGYADSEDLPPALPICLICLEMLTPQDFASGEAMQLDCLCKGEVAMRHRACAIEWSNVKGNLICDICKAPILNLPDIDPAIVAAREEARRRRQPLFAIHPDPTLADYVFDAIRVAWITVICCILFMEDVSVTKAFAVGAVVGALYCLLSVVLHALYSAWRRARQARRGGQQGVTRDMSNHVLHQGGDATLIQPLLIPGQPESESMV